MCVSLDKDLYPLISSFISQQILTKLGFPESVWNSIINCAKNNPEKSGKIMVFFVSQFSYLCTTRSENEDNSVLSRFGFYN